MAKNIPMGEWSGSDATDQLRAVIEKHQEETARQTTKMVRLTWWMTFLTIVMTATTFVQIWLAWRGG
jgi:hypothetical protein